MVEHIDYEKRLTCEDYLALWYFYSKIRKPIPYRDLQVTEELIDRYNRADDALKEFLAGKIRSGGDLVRDFRKNYREKVWEYEKPVIWGDREKSAYYIGQLTDSHKFEVYVGERFLSHGYDIGFFYGKEQQYRKGETRAGIEIKYDKMLTKTGNLYIEYQERLNSRQMWVNSGILKEDETKFYLIGNMHEFYILPRERLCSYYDRLVRQHERIPGMRTVRETKHQTSKGFVLQRSIARRDGLTIPETIRRLKH